MKRYNMPKRGQEPRVQPIQRGRTCGIKVNHLPLVVSQRELKECFGEYGNIVSVRMGQGDRENYAFINYTSLAEAKRAAAAMNGSKRLCETPITVRVQGERSTSSGECTVKATCLAKDIDAHTLEDVFSFSGELVISSKLNSCDGPFNYAYVNYTSPEDAERAVQELDGRRISGSNIKVKIHDSGGTPTSPFQGTPHMHQPFSTPVVSPRQRGPINSPHTVQCGIYPRSDIPPLHPRQFMTTAPRGNVTSFTHPQQLVSSHQRSMNQSSTVKVSLQGDLHSDDLQEVFSRFGTIREKPVIYPGMPNYAYINFMYPQEAQAACKFNGAEIKGIYVQVKISPKKGATNQDCRPLPCDPLIARLLTSKHQEEVDKIAKPQQVSVKKMKNGNGVNLWGEPAALEMVEAYVKLLIDKLQKEIKSCSFTLSCLYVPLFRSQEIFSRVEEKHEVEFTVTDSSKPGGDVTISAFERIISNHFSGGASSNIPQVSLISNFLVNSPAADQTEKVWFWEDDSGGYTPYTSDVCSTLNKQFAANSNSSIPCVVTSRYYTINFANMTQINDETGTERKIKCESGSPTWMYRNDQKQFVPYTPQDGAAIERMYKSKLPTPLTISGRRYTFDFTTGNMRQINIDTKHHRQVQRHATASIGIVAHELKLQVRGLQPSLQAAINELRQELDRGVITKKLDLPSSSDAAFHDSLLQMINQYFIRGNIARGKIELQGIQEYVERVALLVHKETLAYERKILLQTSLVSGTVGQVPNHWDPQADKVELKPVSRGTTEWNRVQTLIHKTLPSSQIIQLDRIQNIWLWQMYSFSKQRMSEKNGGVVNEKDLFHGTRSSPPEKIFKSEKGFDFRFASKGMWGEGTYFAVNASYSNNYAYGHCGRKQMILATVLTGETCHCPPNQSLKKPPAKSMATSSKTGAFADDYDSVSGHTNGSDIFVIYDHEKAYPTYLITYRHGKRQHSPLHKGPTYGIKVKRLPITLSQCDLEKRFGQYGKIVSVRMGKGGTENYAFINYASLAEAEKAAVEMNGSKTYGTPITVRVQQKRFGARDAVFSRLGPPTHASVYPRLGPPKHADVFCRLGPQVSDPNSFSCSQQATQTMAPQLSMNQSSTVKVSLQGDLHSDDLHEVFSQFGTIREKPVIYPGMPNYAYINFMYPLEAQAACKFNGSEIKGIYVQVEISQKKGATNQDCRPLPCDPLIARLLTSKHQEEVDKIAKPQQVSVKEMKNGNGINLWGESAALEMVETNVKLLLEKIQEEIKSCSFTLPCLYVPLFRNQETFSRVEEKHEVEFTVTDSSKPGGDVTISAFEHIISNHFSGGASSNIPQVSLISNFLESSPAADQTEKVWFWEDDSSGYTPYTPDVCSTLNKQFAATPNSSIPCVVTNRHYTINFANMTQINDETGTERKIKCESSSPTWMYRNDQKQFVPYTPQDAAAIERMYKSKLPTPLTISGRRYTFDFTAGNMRQINIDTKHHRQVQRHATASIGIVAHELKLQVRGLQPSLQAAINELRQELDRGVITKKLDLPSSSDAAFHDSLLQMINQYFIRGNITKGKIELQGTQEYVERVALLVHKETLAYYERRILLGEVPNDWDPQDDKVELKPVSRGTPEWNRVETLMHKTLPSSQIIQLDRIQNIWLWQMYSFSKQRMSEKNGGVVNEKDLFHGTRSSPPEKIFKSEKGFDFRCASKGMWGEGTYFAVNASYSDNYAYGHCGRKQMILATVLTGETCHCPPNQSLKKPPAKSMATSSKTGAFADDYDSVSGHTNGSDIFVIYDHEKAYPTYLITYR